MSFALTNYRAYGVLNDSATPRKARQYVELHVTGLAADVSLDISNDAGTFWSDALADTDYGTVASSALEHIKKVADACEKLVSVDAEELVDRVKVAALTAPGQYTLAVNSKRPDIAFDAGDGETSYVLVLSWLLNDQELPLVYQ